MCVPVSIVAFVSHVLPTVVGYFMVAVLAITPKTHTLRVALWPAIALLASRSAAYAELLFCDPDRRFGNALFKFSMIFVATRTLDWTLSKRPLTRHLRPTGGPRSTFMDAFDLACALRGYGWDWSGRVYIPPDTRPTNRQGFLFHVITSAAIHALLCGIAHIAVRSVSPMGIGATGGSIFDDALPFHVRHLRASLISACAVSGIYAFIQACYDVCTLFGLLLGQAPTQWPPAFDAPWRATSMTDFWGRRWHQFCRRTFLVQGGLPLAFMGRPGLVVGAFLSSGWMHYIAMVVFDDRLDPWPVLVGFGMMAPVVLVEHAFKRCTGRKVAGVGGWVWTMAWLLILGNPIIDGFARCGLFGRLNFTESVVPRKDVVAGLVASLEAWLRVL